MKTKIYHNPRCSKSRAALALLEQRGIETEIVHYLEHPPSKTELRALVDKLGVPALALVRTDEPEFREHRGKDLSDDAVLDLLAAQPRLLQRPIVEVGTAARIGRPPELVLELLE